MKILLFAFLLAAFLPVTVHGAGIIVAKPRLAVARDFVAAAIKGDVATLQGHCAKMQAAPDLNLRTKSAICALLKEHGIMPFDSSRPIHMALTAAVVKGQVESVRVLLECEDAQEILVDAMNVALHFKQHDVFKLVARADPMALWTAFVNIAESEPELVEESVRGASSETRVVAATEVIRDATPKEWCAFAALMAADELAQVKAAWKEVGPRDKERTAMIDGAIALAGDRSLAKDKKHKVPAPSLREPILEAARKGNAEAFQTLWAESGDVDLYEELLPIVPSAFAQLMIADPAVVQSADRDALLAPFERPLSTALSRCKSVAGLKALNLLHRRFHFLDPPRLVTLALYMNLIDTEDAARALVAIRNQSKCHGPIAALQTVIGLTSDALVASMESLGDDVLHPDDPLYGMRQALLEYQGVRDSTAAEYSEMMAFSLADLYLRHRGSPAIASLCRHLLRVQDPDHISDTQRRRFPMALWALMPVDEDVLIRAHLPDHAVLLSVRKVRSPSPPSLGPSSSSSGSGSSSSSSSSSGSSPASDPALDSSPFPPSFVFRSTLINSDEEGVYHHRSRGSFVPFVHFAPMSFDYVRSKANFFCNSQHAGKKNELYCEADSGKPFAQLPVPLDAPLVARQASGSCYTSAVLYWVRYLWQPPETPRPGLPQAREFAEHAVVMSFLRLFFLSEGLGLALVDEDMWRAFVRASAEGFRAAIKAASSASPFAADLRRLVIDTYEAMRKQAPAAIDYKHYLRHLRASITKRSESAWVLRPELTHYTARTKDGGWARREVEGADIVENAFRRTFWSLAKMIEDAYEPLAAEDA